MLNCWARVFFMSKRLFQATLDEELTNQILKIFKKSFCFFFAENSPKFRFLGHFQSGQTNIKKNREIRRVDFQSYTENILNVQNCDGPGRKPPPMTCFNVKSDTKNFRAFAEKTLKSACRPSVNFFMIILLYLQAIGKLLSSRRHIMKYFLY